MAATIERKLTTVPRWIIFLLLLSLTAQIALRSTSSDSIYKTSSLPQAPNKQFITSIFMGDQVLAGRLLMLWLQARDTQSGKLILNHQRDYQQLSQWLLQLHALDPNSHYPLLLAGRVYIQSNDSNRMRAMLKTVHQLFLNNPAHFWRWQAEAAVIAKHRLKDKSLALRLANDLSSKTPVDALPLWAKDLQFILMEELGYQKELELLIGGLIASGHVSETKELQWLNKRLLNIQME